MRYCTFYLIPLLTLLFIVLLTYGQCYYDIGVPKLGDSKDSSSQSQKYCPVSSGLCPTMIFHLSAILALSSLILVNLLLLRVRGHQNMALPCMIILTCIYWLFTLPIYYFFNATDPD